MSQSKTFYFCWNVRKSVVKFSPMQCNLDRPEKTGSLVSFCMPRQSNSYFFSSMGSIFPSKCQSIVFYLKQTVLFWMGWILSSTSELESRVTKIGESAFSIEILWYSKSSLSETSDLDSSIKVSFEGISEQLLNGTITDCVPYTGLFIGWTCEKTKYYSH